MSQKLSKREALNEVAKVLEAALAEYESLEKMDFEGEESEEEKAEKEAAAQAEAAQSQEAPAEESEEAPAEEQSADESEEAPADEAAPSEEEEEEENEMNDEALKSEYAKLTKKMSERGLMKTEIKKSETATDLKKYETQISDLSKTVSDLQATIKKIANTPVSKGVKGYNPLKKNTEEEAKPLNKGEVINTILNLKKSGKAVPQGIVNRIEGNRMSEQDVNYIKGIVG